MSVTRSVAVMMAFGREASRRENVLKFKRIQHIVENLVLVHAKDSDDRIRYRAEVVDVKAGVIDKPIIRALLTSDVVIGIVGAGNVNVVYEVAVRNALRGAWVLLTEDQGAVDALPLYLKQLAHIRTDQEGGDAVAKWIIAQAAQATGPRQFSDPIPEELKRVVDEWDGFLRSEMEAALASIEHSTIPPALVDDNVEYLHPWLVGAILEKWTTYYPFGIWKIRWKGKAHENAAYELEDMDGEPTLSSGNQLLASLFAMTGFGGNFPPDPNGPDALSQSAALRIIKRDGIIEAEPFAAFDRDQAELVKRLILADQFAQAKEPMRFNAKHPDPDFRNRAVMPHAFAKHTLGKTTEPHTTYLFVVYV